MKKALSIFLLFAAFGTAGFFLVKKVVHHVPAVALAPADTILFADIPNVPRSALRWRKTGLAQIIAEPEVQKFLEKSRANGADGTGWDAKMAQFARLVPGEIFVAVTSIDGAVPKFVAGFSFLGKKKDAEALLADPRAELKKAWPAGKSDLVMHGSTEIETFTFGDMTVGEAFKDDWYFVADDMELLRKTLDACGGAGRPGLGEAEIFKKATAKLPVEGDFTVFASLATVTDRLASLLVASGQAADPKQLAEIKRMQAVAWGTKIEGEKMRDTLFLLAPGAGKESALALHAASLWSGDSFLSYVMRLPEKIEIPESAGLIGGLIPGLAGMEKALSEKGLTWGDLGKAFGPELGVVADWREADAQPSALISVDLRDAVKARAFVEAFTSTAPGTPAWTRSDTDGVGLFQSPPGEGLIPVAPTLALTDRALLVGFSPESIQGAIARSRSGSAPQLSKETIGPTSGYAMLDMKRLFERGYGTMRPFIAMSLAFSPDAAKYVDAGKLPGTESISKHLAPSVYSQSVTDEGTLVESVGTLTFNQVLLGAIGGSVAAAFPMIESALGSGMKLDPSLLQLPQPGGSAPSGVSGQGAPPAKFANPEPSEKAEL
jgi:hypothetical protein